MLPVLKHLDIVVGIDTHMVTLPLSPSPTPMPHPFIGIVFDPMGYIPFLGTQVYINGQKRANAETEITLLSKIHTPLGLGFHPTFISRIHHDGNSFYGSNTVNADGHI